MNNGDVGISDVLSRAASRPPKWFFSVDGRDKEKLEEAKVFVKHCLCTNGFKVVDKKQL